MIRIAQIGCGYWGPNLLRNLMANPDCEVSHLIDLSPGRRSFAGSLYPRLSLGAEVEAVFADPRVDGVVIATPAGTHYTLARAALAAGKHILVEKPMACTVAEVEALDALAKKKSLVAMVGHTFLFNPAVRFLKETIQSGQVGEVRYIYSRRLNLGRIRADVDVLWNLGPHDVSIIQYLLDDPQPLSVQRRGMDFIQEGIEDVVFLNITYPGQVMANIHLSWLDPHRTRELVVVGTKKMVVYDDTADYKIAVYDKGIEPVAVLGKNMDFDRPPPAVFSHRKGDVHFPQIKMEEPLAVEIAHFLDCIANGTPCLTDAAHARKVVAILSEAT